MRCLGSVIQIERQRLADCWRRTAEHDVQEIPRAVEMVAGHGNAGGDALHIFRVGAEAQRDLDVRFGRLAAAQLQQIVGALGMQDGRAWRDRQALVADLDRGPVVLLVGMAERQDVIAALFERPKLDRLAGDLGGGIGLPAPP